MSFHSEDVAERQARGVQTLAHLEPGYSHVVLDLT
jgi:hypothetical protein